MTKQYKVLFPIFVVVVLLSFASKAIPKANADVLISNTASSNIVPGQEVQTSTVPGYFEVTSSCDWQFENGPCVNVRTGPGVSYPRAIMYFSAYPNVPVGNHAYQVRDGQVFKVSQLVEGTDGQLWLKIAINKNNWLYPNRIQSDWYVAAQYFQPVQFTHIDPQNDSKKHILIVLHTQTLYAQEGSDTIETFKVSTGKSYLPTPTGNFHVMTKSPVVTMEGPLPGLPIDGPTDYYTLFVPFSMAFYCPSGGCDFLHAAYWHDSFGQTHSHGCVNLDFSDAEWLYNWTPNPSVLKIPVQIVP